MRENVPQRESNVLLLGSRAVLSSGLSLKHVVHLLQIPSLKLQVAWVQEAEYWHAANGMETELCPFLYPMTATMN